MADTVERVSEREREREMLHKAQAVIFGSARHIHNTHSHSHIHTSRETGPAPWQNNRQQTWIQSIPFRHWQGGQRGNLALAKQKIHSTTVPTYVYTYKYVYMYMSVYMYSSTYLSSFFFLRFELITLPHLTYLM